MKRLIKKAFGKIYYHGTSFAAFKDIISSGALLPNAQAGGSDLLQEDKLEHYDGYSFVSPNIRKAVSYAGSVSSNDFIDVNRPLVVLEVDLDPASLIKDVESYNDFKLVGSISSEYFRNVHFFNCENSKEVFSVPFNNWEAEYQKNIEGFNTGLSNFTNLGYNPYLFESESFDENGNVTSDAKLSFIFYYQEIESHLMNLEDDPQYSLGGEKYGFDLPTQYMDYPLSERDVSAIKTIIRQNIDNRENENLERYSSFDIQGYKIIVTF